MTRNKFNYFFISTIVYLLFYASVFAQEIKIDSILTLIKNEKADTTKVNYLNLLSSEFKSNNPDTAIYFAKQALYLAQQKNFEKGIAESYLWIGTAIAYQGKYGEALSFLFKSLGLCEKINNKAIKARVYNNIGFVYFNQGNYPEAFKNHFASLKIKEEIGDKSGIAGSYNNIGNIYNNQGNYSEALKNHHAALEIRKAIAEKKGIATSYNNIGNVYGAEGNYSEALKNFISSLKIAEETGNKVGAAASYHNIATVYFEQGNYPEALKNFFSSLKMEEEIGNKAGMASSSIGIGIIYSKQKKFIEAGKCLVKAKELCIEIGFKDYIREVYGALTELDSAKGNYRGAYENHKLFILYSDSLDNEETRRKTIQSQMTYDFEKKEAVAETEHKKELENQELIANERSHKQKIVLLLVSCFLLLVLFFAGFIFRSLRITRKQKKLIEAQKNIVEEQKKQVEQQKLLVEEHQKEIIDSITYARRIQQSLLPTEKFIERTLNRINK